MADTVVDKIEHEGMGTAGIKIRQDADNANQKVKWFLKVHTKKYILLWEAYFWLSFFPKFLFTFTFYKFSIFIPLKMRFKHSN